MIITGSGNLFTWKLKLKSNLALIETKHTPHGLELSVCISNTAGINRFSAWLHSFLLDYHDCTELHHFCYKLSATCTNKLSISTLYYNVYCNVTKASRTCSAIWSGFRKNTHQRNDVADHFWMLGVFDKVSKYWSGIMLQCWNRKFHCWFTIRFV